MLLHPWRTLTVLVLLGLIGGSAALAGTQLWALYHFRAARTAVQRYHNREAQEHLQACLNVWPHDADTLLLAARTARRTGALDEAEQLLERCRAAQGSDEDLALERMMLQATRGDVDRVEKVCADLVTRNHPATPLVLEALAYGCLNGYRLQEAGYVLGIWLEREPNNSQAYLLRGILFLNLGRRDEAGADFEHVLELDPEHEEARQRLVDYLVEAGKARDALPHAEYLARRRPEDPGAQLSVALCKDLLGEQDEAERLLDRILTKAPHFGPALAARGRIALRTGEPDKAEELLRQAVTVQPDDYSIHYQFHLALLANGKAEEAKQEQARMKQISEDLSRVQEIIRHKMEESPHDPALHYEVGMSALRLGKLSEAVRWFESALREDPNYAPAHKALAEYYQRIGDLMRASHHRALAGQAPPDPGAEPGKGDS
jgi:tetratricopeptide (TPR) repeat protein